MSGIKRFNHRVCEYPGGTFSEMNQEDDGDYVLHSDHEAEVARLRAELQNAAPPAQVVGLGQFREAVEMAMEVPLNGVQRQSLQRLLALIDSKAVGK